MKFISQTDLESTKISDHELYAVKILPVRPRLMLVAVAGVKVWIFSVSLDPQTNDSIDKQLLYTWTPESAAPAEEYMYSMELLVVPAGNKLARAGDILCIAAGKAGFIHVLNISCSNLVCSIPIDIGRIEINEIARHPRVWHWVGVACKDNGIRIVDLCSKRVILILGGIHAHQQQVLSMDFHPTLPLIVSGGADNTARLWTIPPDQELEKAEPIRIHTSLYASSWVHASFVDSIKFLGDTTPSNVSEWSPLVVSKSTDGEIAVFRFPTTTPNVMDQQLVADTDERGPRPDFLALVQFPPHKLWFFKLTLATPHVLVLGLANGTVLVWDLRACLNAVHQRLLRWKDPSNVSQMHRSWPAIQHLTTLKQVLVPTITYQDQRAGPVLRLDTRKDVPVRMAAIHLFLEDDIPGVQMFHWLVAAVSENGVVWLGVLQNC